MQIVKISPAIKDPNWHVAVMWVHAQKEPWKVGREWSFPIVSAGVDTQDQMRSLLGWVRDYLSVIHPWWKDAIHAAFEFPVDDKLAGVVVHDE
jgi:hypothetical protein